MKIIVRLPKERKSKPPFDRASYGQLVVADGEAILLGPFPCLGKGGRSKQARSGDWKLRGNDTPAGEYIGKLEQWHPAETYGPNESLRLIPTGGNARIAAEIGRAGLAIHGGRDQKTLWSTEGCVRVFDRHMKEITDIMKKRGMTEIPVEVIES